MSTHAIKTSDTGRGMRIARNIDLIFLALALAFFVALGLPILGWVTGAGAWVAQRLLRDFLTSRARKADDPREMVGYLAGSMIGRGWLVAGAILAIGLTTESEVGLSSAVLFLATFTVALTMTLATCGAQAHTPRGPRT